MTFTWEEEKEGGIGRERDGRNERGGEERKEGCVEEERRWVFNLKVQPKWEFEAQHLTAICNYSRL